MNNSLLTVFNIFNKLPLQQKILIGGAVILMVVVFTFTIIVFNEPDYSVLYNNMEEEDAAKVVENLTAQKIPYQLTDNGKTIKVPKEQLYEIRLSMAAKGIPGSGIIGYEIFDQSSMGMSEFMQKLNYKRALEGELARTIMQQDGVEGVRIHIVTPQKSVFKNEEKAPTASVVLKLKNNFSLSKNNIAAITNLISGSVEGLEAGKVTLLDTKGRLLNKDDDSYFYSGANIKQYEIKQMVETYLISKAQSILDNVIGYGNSVVQVNAELNFDQVERTMETFDPESQVIISEQTIKNESGGKTYSDSTSQTNENLVTNYEINKTVERVIRGSGNIKRLTVAAVINDEKKEVKQGDELKYVFETRPKEQIEKLENILKHSVGIDITRNDEFSLVNLPFESSEYVDVIPEEASMFNNIDKWGNIIFIIGGLAAALLLLKGLMSKLKNEKIVIGTFGGVNYTEENSQNQIGIPKTNYAITEKKKYLLPVGDIEDEISEEAMRKKNRQEKISNYVTKNPAEAAKLINAWLHEEEL